VAPRNAIEQVLCEVWAEVLKRERVGVQDNFFSVGGDSILSIRIVSLLKSRGLVIDIKDIFQHQTIAQLAPYIGQNASHDMDFVDNKKIEKMLSRNRHKSNENDVRIII
jgi:aryl carrier-like protein